MTRMTPSQKAQHIIQMNNICITNSFPIQFSDADWMDYTLGISTWPYNDHPNNPLKSYLRNLIPDLSSNNNQSFYRYFKPKQLNLLLKTKKIQMSSMRSNAKNDSLEYIGYFKTLGSNVNPSVIDDAQNSTYILCFSDSHDDKKIWKEYVNNTGVCIECVITPKEPSKRRFWEFRSVYYGVGTEFSTLTDIITQFKNMHNIDIVFPTHKFAQFYKRDSYSWERESRICIQEESLSIVKDEYEEIFKELVRKSEMHQWGERRYIDVPLRNSMFDIEIKKVYLGPKFSILKNIPMMTRLIWSKIPYEKVK